MLGAPDFLHRHIGAKKTTARAGGLIAELTTKGIKVTAVLRTISTDLFPSISLSCSELYLRAQQHEVGLCSTTLRKMIRSTSFIASDTQQSPALTLGERSAFTGDSGSVSGTDDEDAISDTAVNGSKKRKHTHVKISYVAPLPVLLTFRAARLLFSTLADLIKM